MKRNIVAVVLILTLLSVLFSCAKQAVVEDPLKEGLYVEKRVIKKTCDGYIIFNVKGRQNK